MAVVIHEHTFCCYVVTFRAVVGRTALHFAVTADAQRVFQVLLRNKQTNINEKAHDGTTAMILAVKMATEGMVEELIQSKVASPHISPRFSTV